MAESTLSLALADLQLEAGFYMGYGSDSDDWTTDESDFIDRVIPAAYRRFLYPVVPRQVQRGAALVTVMETHQWTWLTPVVTIDIWPTVTGTVSGSPSYDGSTYSTITATEDKFYESMEGKSFTFDTSGTSYTIASYVSATEIKVEGDASGETSGDTFTVTSDSSFPLPDDFGGVEGPFTFEANQRSKDLQVYGEGLIRHKRQVADVTGPPCMASVRPSSFSGSSGQRYTLDVWPDVDKEYTLYYRKKLLLDKLTTSSPYPIGGMQYSELLKALVRATAEEMDARPERFERDNAERMLISAVDEDRKSSTPETLGLLGPRRLRRFDSMVETVTFENVEY